MFENSIVLDTQDPLAFRRQAHRMLDDMLDYVDNIAQRPVWREAPESVEADFGASLPREPQSLSDVHAKFKQSILPFAVGNAHPGFMGWAHGGGTLVGMVAEMLSAGLNANLGGRDHIPIAVEQQVVGWMRELFGFPNSASGLFVTGSSLANFIALLIARSAKLGTAVRRTGLREHVSPLVCYASQGTHGCVARALEMAGIGSEQLRLIGVNDRFEIDIAQLNQAIAADRAVGKLPFCVVGNAGTVDVGAIDDLRGIAEVCRRESLWFHVDGACGALGKLSNRLAPRFDGIELADSLALDFHKWAQVPYDAGFVLVRDSQLHRDTFAAPAAYLSRATRGLAAGSVWPCDYGPDLSRSFKALKVWFTFNVYGAIRLGEMMDRSCDLATYLSQQIDADESLELLAPTSLNIVCFRYRPRAVTDEAYLNQLNAELVVAIQESGRSAPSSTILHGRTTIRAAIFNHRTQRHDIDELLAATRTLGEQLRRRAPDQTTAKE